MTSTNISVAREQAVIYPEAKFRITTGHEGALRFANRQHFPYSLFCFTVVLYYSQRFCQSTHMTI